MKKFRTIATIGALSVAGLGLIGAGAHAVFTQNTVSSQQIQAGTMNVTLSSTAAGVNGINTPTLTFANFGPTNSSFTTGDNLVTITNNSNIPVLEIVSTPSDTYDSSGGATSANSELAAQVYLCEVSSGEVIYNGLLADASAQGISGTLAPLGTDNYTVNVYAGNSVNTACGSVTSVGAPAPATDGPNPAATDLSNDAQGGVINPTMTVSYSG